MDKQLTEKQQNQVEQLLSIILSKDHLLLSAHPRQTGKTTIINELGLNVQALGYNAYVLTPFQAQEYYATRFLSLKMEDYKGIINDKIVFLVDEAKYHLMNDFMNYCILNKIPVVGFVDFYNVNAPVK